MSGTIRGPSGGNFFIREFGGSISFIGMRVKLVFEESPKYRQLDSLEFVEYRSFICELR